MRKSALIWLGLVVVSLVTLGLIVLASAGGVNSARYFHGDAYHLITRQCGYVAVGLVIAVILAKVDYRLWRRYPILTYLAFFAVMALLWWALTFSAVKGSHRWIYLGSVSLQPGELAKFMLVLILAVWLDLASWKVERYVRGCFIPSVFVGMYALPLLNAPDYGSVFVLGLIAALMMIVAGTRFLHLLTFLLLGSVPLVWEVVHNPNRMARMAAFFNIKLDLGAEVSSKAVDAASDQLRMALVAIKNGGIWGVGLGQSMQKLAYLPEAHTDFIFAIGAEELGIAFSLGVFVLFLAFFALSMYIAKHAQDRFGRLLVVGMAFVICFEAIFNIGVVSGAFPTKGMALPFFSYGGTNMLCSFFAVGMIFSVGIHSLSPRRGSLARAVMKR